MLFVVLYLRLIMVLVWSYCLVTLLCRPVDSFLWVVYGNTR